MILVVNHNSRNLELIAHFLEKEEYETLKIESLEKMDRVLAGKQKISLALLDLAGFDNSIWVRCKQLQDKNIPFIIISPKQSMAIQQESVSHGAKMVLVKPLVVKELLGLIRGLLGE